MKNINILYLALAFVALSCTKEITPQANQKTEDEAICVPMEFTTGLETKTSLDGNQVLWTKDEKVAIITGGTIYEFKALEASSNSILSGEAPEADEYYACYPFDKNVSHSGTTFSNCNLNPNQSGKAGTYYTQTSPMVGKSDADKNITFKNLASHIKFTLAEDIEGVEYIILMGNNNEHISGKYSVNWNNGDPIVTPTSGNTYKYVSLKNPNGGTLAPGDYYFTIFPIEFTKGFTVILQMEDGTQIAKKTNNALPALKRNQILPMAALSKADYSDHMNYYAKYVVGKDITIGGETFNNKSGLDVTLIDGTKAVDINSGKLYFVFPGIDNTNTSTRVRLHLQNAETTYTKMYIIGTERDNRSDIILQTNLLDCNNATQILANLDFTVSTGSNIMKGGSYLIAGGKMIISNCSFDAVTVHPMNLTNSSSCTSFEKLVVEDSEFGLKYTSPYFFNLRGLTATLNTAEIRNNIFYAVNTTINDFKLFDLNNGAVSNLDVSNNTFVGTLGAILGIAGNGAGTESFKFDYNLFNIALTKTVALVSQATVENAPKSGSCQHNYYFSSDDFENDQYYMYLPSINNANLNPYIAPQRLFKSPLSQTWEPANGLFGAYDIETYDPDAQPDATIIIGAQRNDMVTATPTASDANLASYNYATINAGTL